MADKECRRALRWLTRFAAMAGDQAFGELGCGRREEQRRLSAPVILEKQSRAARPAAFHEKIGKLVLQMGVVVSCLELHTPPVFRHGAISIPNIKPRATNGLSTRDRGGGCHSQTLRCRWQAHRCNEQRLKRGINCGGIPSARR